MRTLSTGATRRLVLGELVESRPVAVVPVVVVVLELVVDVLEESMCMFDMFDESERMFDVGGVVVLVDEELPAVLSAC